MVKFLQKYFKKGITSILILSIFSTIFLPLSTIYAQQNGGYNTGGGSEFFNSTSSTSVSGYLTSLGPIIGAAFPLCKEQIQTFGVKSLFKGTKGLLAEKNKLKESASQLSTSTFQTEAGAIPIWDEEGWKKAVEITEKLGEHETYLKSLSENDTCLKSIGRLVVKMLLQKLTLSTVEWINNGYQGSPFFIENPSKFFEDIAKEEILAFRLNIDQNNPYGKNFLRYAIKSLNQGIQENTRYSLDELIAQTTPEYNSVTFSKSFKLGGWAAWDALTQVPANNPLGFNIIASTELSKKLAGTSQNKAEETREILAQSGGFLGDYQCVDPKGLTRAENQSALVKGDRDGLCKKWEYRTPGKIVAEFATGIVGYPKESILSANDLNTAIATIADAALSNFVSGLANKGLTALGTDGIDGSYVESADSGLYGTTYSQVELDFPKTLSNTSWLKENPDFNIRTDLTQALIDEQRIYQQRLEEENRVLNDLIMTVYQLDYCIPGPHPDWEDDSDRALSGFKQSIPSKTEQDFENLTISAVLGIAKSAAYIGGAAIGASIGTAAFPVIGTAVGAAIGALVGFLIDLFNTKEPNELLMIFYASFVQSTTGIHVLQDSSDTDALINSKGIVVNALDTIFDRYIRLIRKHYSGEILPSITPQARTEFRRVEGYREKMANNEYQKNVLTGVINRLGNLKDKLDSLDPESAPYSEYETLINEFGRLSASMVTGNDIATVIQETQEEASQIKYIYDDLLTGPYGCEEHMAKLNYPENTDNGKVLRTLRATYPFEILYDYNTLSAGDPIPNPPDDFVTKYKLKTPTERKSAPNLIPSYHVGPFLDEKMLSGSVMIEKAPSGTSTTSTAYGPGFLSRVAYDHKTDEGNAKAISCKARGSENKSSEAENELLGCLEISDLFNKVYRWPALVGRKQGGAFDNEGDNNNPNRDISFEQLIGIY